MSNCRERWRHIRSSFLRSLRIPLKGSGNNGRKKYYLSDYLKFVLPYIKIKTNNGNLKSLLENNESSEEEDGESREITGNQGATNRANSVNSFKKLKVCHIASATPHPIDDPFVEWHKSKKEREDFKKENDPNMSFFHSLLPDIIKMTDKQNRRFRQKVIGLIDEILEDADFKPESNLS